MSKKLITDIGNQIILPTIAISTDTTNCFDYIAYPFATLTYRHFDLQIEYIILLFILIQIIKIYLLISFGLSNKFYSSSSTKPFQGDIQGSRSAGANWLLITIFLVSIYTLRE